MNFRGVRDYAAMSRVGADAIFDAMAPALRRGERFNLGTATGNTMIELYRLLAARCDAEALDLCNLHTWNLDEYLTADRRPVRPDHPLSYRKYMTEKLFFRFAPERNFGPENRHFPDPADGAGFDRALAAAGGLDFQLLGLGFNGHIAFNEPEPEAEVADFAARPTRVVKLTELTLATNSRLTARGDDALVPRFAVSMGMKPILAARRILLLTCFPEQAAPLRRMATGTITPALPASYLSGHPDAEIVYTEDTICLS